MSVMEKLEEMLASRRASYELIRHPAAYSSQMTAQAEHVSGKEEVKVVVVNAGGRDVMLVLPANQRVDLDKVSRQLGQPGVKLENEEKFRNLFPDSETGAMPPFGHLYGLPVYADVTLAENEFITFNAGSHSEAIRMAYTDFERIEDPTLAYFSTKAG